MKFLKHLSQPSIIGLLRGEMTKTLTDTRIINKSSISLVDTCISALAMFQLKVPSLLQFDDAARTDDVVQSNLKTLYQINKVPCDTQMRTILDEVDPTELRSGFTQIFKLLQSAKALPQFNFYQNKLLLAIDGTGYFSSQSIRCDSCCIKNHQNGSTTYYHQALAAVFIHPDKKAVIPLCPEPIILQDGAVKNDCERNAAERLLCHVRREHPHLEIIVTEDGLASNGPHIKTLQQLRLSFILGAKPGDHVTLYARLHQAARDSALKQLTYLEDGFQYQYLWMNSLPLNATHPECVVNFLELTVTDLKQDKSTVFSWVTDLDLHEDSVVRVAQGGRARWKIENETFNTLKNQGYNFEHNFGHGKKNLSVNLMLLMFLAFLIDQVLQLVCPFFRAALAASVRKAALWRKMRNYFEYFLFKDWEHFYHALIFKIKRQHAIIDTS